MAGSIRAGCCTDSGRYRPRRWTGPVACAVAQTDRPSARGAMGRCRAGTAAPAGRMGPSGESTVVRRLATAATALAAGAPRRTHGNRQDAEDQQIGVDAQVRHARLLPGGGEREEFL